MIGAPVTKPAPDKSPTAPRVSWCEPGSSASERLAGEVGVMAGRLAEYLSVVLADDHPAVTESREFLQQSFELVAEGQPLSAFAGGPWQRRPADVYHPLDRLVDRLQLCTTEFDLLLLAGFAEQHEGCAQVLKMLHHAGEPRATVGLAAQLLCNDDRSRHTLRWLLECGPAATAGVIRTDGDLPFFLRNLRLADELWPVLNEIDRWPTGIERLRDPVSLYGLDDWLNEPQVSRAVEMLRRFEPCTLLVTDDESRVAFSRGSALAAAAGAASVQIRIPAAMSSQLHQVMQVHVLARGIVPILRYVAPDGPEAVEIPSFADFPAPVVLCARDGTVILSGTRPILGITCTRLRPSALETMWARTLPALAEQASLLAARYPLEPAAALHVACDMERLQDIEKRKVCCADVSGSVRARAGSALRGGVKLMRPTANWEHLILPPERLAQLREAVERLTHQTRVLDEWRFLEGRRGARGVRLLLAGPPGTGKTLSGEVLASALQVDLLVVDLSRVVSKWIGETEKNLAEVFETAERCRAVLLFDEADALFGKRTEVSDAHDRYANLETAYLLARLERFEGLAILSTNLRQNIDPAFSRRLEFVVEFGTPDYEQRLALWRCHLPATSPLADDVNIEELAATYPIVGGLIRNAAVAAAFLAATDNTAITRDHFLWAIRREYEKSGKAFPGLPAGMSGPQWRKNHG